MCQRYGRVFVPKVWTCLCTKAEELGKEASCSSLQTFPKNHDCPTMSGTLVLGDVS